MGETEVSSQLVIDGRQPWEVVLGGRQPWKVRSWRRSDRVIRSDRFQLSEGVQSSR
jgi:hypothetical protein